MLKRFEDNCGKVLRLVILFVMVTVPASAEVLSWPSVSGAVKYRIQRSNDPTTSQWQVPFLAEVTTTSYDYPAPYAIGDTWFGATALDANGKELRIYYWCRRASTSCPPMQLLP